MKVLYHEATYGKELEAVAKENFHSTAEQAACICLLYTSPNKIRKDMLKSVYFPKRKI